MNETMTRRRPITDQGGNYPLTYQLVILLRSRKEVMYLCTKSSLALRVVGLCDLCIQNAIELQGRTVKVVRNIEDCVLKEFVYKISQVSYDPKRIVKYINGEVGSTRGIRNLRNKIYKEMESRSIIKSVKGPVFNKIFLKNSDIWQSIFGNITREVNAGFLSTGSIVLLISLDYMDHMESVLLQCNEVLARSVVNAVNSQKDRIKKKLYPKEDELLYEFLDLLI